MGYKRELYDDEYYVSGALGFKEYFRGDMYRNIRQMVDMVPSYAGRSVLDIGFGRGEVLQHALSKGANPVVGVDFSESAHDYAKQLSTGATLYLGDVLDYLDILGRTKFDYVFMLDVIEHIPASEIDTVLSGLQIGTLLVSTPYYSVYEDYIEQGCRYKIPSQTDIKSPGMHCTKYTKKALLEVLRRNNVHDYRPLH